MVATDAVKVQYRVNDDKLKFHTVENAHIVVRNYDEDFLSIHQKDGGEVTFNNSVVVRWESGENVETRFQ